MQRHTRDTPVYAHCEVCDELMTGIVNPLASPVHEAVRRGHVLSPAELVRLFCDDCEADLLAARQQAGQ